MLSPRWRKMLRDLWLQKARTLLVILAVAVGVFGVGSVLTGYAVLTREINDNYLGTRPASATLWTDPLDGDFVQRVRELPEIGDAEARSTLQGRMLVGPNDWRTIQLYVIWDYDDLRLSTFEPERGAWPPADGEILIERSSLPLFGTETPESVVVKLPDGPRHQLPIAGIVHNPGLPPGWMDATGYGYLTPPTAERIGASPVFDQLKITVATRAEDKEHIRRTVARLQEWLGQQGRRVYRVEIPTPGEHPHYAQMFTMMSLLAAFGLLALVLSGVLVANLISALLAREIRQIGVMKAVGARTRQVAGIYFGAVTLFGLAALGVGMPPGLWAGWAFVDYATAIFNFEILGDSVPLWVFAVQAVVGLLVPLAVAAYPIWRGSRTSVREAISDYGVSESAPRRSQRFRPRLPTLRLPRLVVLSSRNTLRRRGRLLLTLATLSASGAVFMVAMNVTASWEETLDAIFAARRYEIDVRLAHPSPVAEMERAIRQVPGVERVESWTLTRASRLRTTADEGSAFALVGAPAETELVDLPVVEGRWLRPEDGNALVASPGLLEQEPDLAVGDEVRLRLGGQETVWQVVGVVGDRGPARAYASYQQLSTVLGRQGMAETLRIATQDQDPAAQLAVTRGVERALEAGGWGVLQTMRSTVYRQAFEDHLAISLALLLLMSVLVVIVGGLSLSATMSLNVLERRREIGVLRAIGASNGKVLSMVLIEGVMIGVASWLLALAPALPLSIFVGNISGQIFLNGPLESAVSLAGIGEWLILVVVLSGLASLYPARSAARLTVREALAYE